MDEISIELHESTQDTAAIQMYELMQERMSEAEISLWVTSVRNSVLTHMAECVEDESSITSLDEAVLTVSECMLYLLGLAQANHLLITTTHSKDLH